MQKKTCSKAKHINLHMHDNNTSEKEKERKNYQVTKITYIKILK